MADFRVIVNRRTLPETGEWTDADPTGYSCKLWGSPAEYLANSVTWGDRVLVHGHVETETWTDRETQAVVARLPRRVSGVPAARSS